ncbi:MAG: BlaI/MecI/CopY family transcriptional regulator [Dysgonamonadaceae bacterium]|jgi:predicted transcriptional regulator|nr:BlaI/MecI/CopY family transcriptional regulator [Dysgonamonadaceae bacterium]
MRSLTPQEEQLMRYVWQGKEGFIRDFRKMYDSKPLPPYTTVATIMKKLEAKGYVSGKRYGNTYEYSPLIEQENYTKASMSAMVSNYFQNSYKEMVTFFAKEEKLSEEDLQAIIKMIKK